MTSGKKPVNLVALVGGGAAIVLIVAMLVLFANRIVAGRDPHQVDSPLVGRMAPGFVLEKVDGTGKVSLEDLKGRPVVLNFWATWCAPCKQEHRVLHDGAKALGDKVRFVGIVYEDEPEAIRDFLNRWGSGYDTLVDTSMNEVSTSYGVYGVPETFFLDPSGKIVAKHEGPLDPPSLFAYVRRVMGTAEVATP